MRHLWGESVEAHEATGKDLGLLLIEAAGLVDTHDGWASVTTQPDRELGYVVMVYLHGA